MILSINGRVENIFMPRYEGKKIVIGIDSSKTNSAIAVGDSSGCVLDYIEVNGVNVGTAEEETLKLCYDTRVALKEIFKYSKPICVGIENIISKITKGKETGMTIHESRFKITAVFMSFISFFQDTFNITPQLINNQTWKAAVLPSEFRKREYKKGSLAYFKSINSRYQYCSDDVTDAICILKYLISANSITEGYKIVAPELSRYKHEIFLVPPSFISKIPIYPFTLNVNMTLEQNAIVMSNVIASKINVLAAAECNVEKLTLQDIYTYCTGVFEKKEKRLKLFVRNVR